VNGMVSKTAFDSSWKDENLYFKTGNYLLENSKLDHLGKVAYCTLSDNRPTVTSLEDKNEGWQQKVNQLQ
jgi:hypothetical protein